MVIRMYAVFRIRLDLKGSSLVTGHLVSAMAARLGTGGLDVKTASGRFGLCKHSVRMEQVARRLAEAKGKYRGDA